MTDISVDQISDFIHQFRALHRSEAIDAVQGFQDAFKQLQEGFHETEQRSIDQARLSAPRFNIFSVLRLSQYEVRTHSALLAHLLNPGASHGQQDLFLSAFLGECAQAFPDFPLPSEDVKNGHWQTYPEVMTPFGRLDIVIRSPDLNYLCVIENKVYAGEQPGQLERYGEWLATQHDDYPQQALIYLTLHGLASNTAQDVKYFRLSYKRDIDWWLIKTIPNIQAPVVKTAVKQYLDLIRKL